MMIEGIFLTWRHIACQNCYRKYAENKKNQTILLGGFFRPNTYRRFIRYTENKDFNEFGNFTLSKTIIMLLLSLVNIMNYSQ